MSRRSKKHRRTRRSSRRNTKRKPISGPVHIISSLDGGSFDASCTCPVCVDMAARGIPLMTMGPDGELVEVTPPKPPPMVEVVVRGTASTWPELDTSPRTISVPVGTVVQDVLGFMRYRDHRLNRGFPPGGLSVSIRGELCEPERVVLEGDELRVSGHRNAYWTAIASQFAPMPGA